MLIIRSCLISTVSRIGLGGMANKWISAHISTRKVQQLQLLHQDTFWSGKDYVVVFKEASSVAQTDNG
jgi:hypothetical protein